MNLVIDMNSKRNTFGFSEFVLPVISIVEEIDECVVKHYLELHSKNLASFDRIILSGSALKNTVTLEKKDLFEWIKDCNIPILGICAGMQTIGLVFEGYLKRCCEIGMTEIFTLKTNPLFSSRFKAFSLHNHEIIPSDEFEVLAKSAKCVQAMKHRRKEIYGVLFHPEVRNREILQKFVHTFSLDQTI